MNARIEKPKPAEQDQVPLAEPDLPADDPNHPRPSTPLDPEELLDTQRQPD